MGRQDQNVAFPPAFGRIISDRRRICRPNSQVRSMLSGVMSCAGGGSSSNKLTAFNTRLAARKRMASFGDSSNPSTTAIALSVRKYSRWAELSQSSNRRARNSLTNPASLLTQREMVSSRTPTSAAASFWFFPDSSKVITWSCLVFLNFPLPQLSSTFVNSEGTLRRWGSHEPIAALASFTQMRRYSSKSPLR